MLMMINFSSENDETLLGVAAVMSGSNCLSLNTVKPFQYLSYELHVYYRLTHPYLKILANAQSITSKSSSSYVCSLKRTRSLLLKNIEPKFLLVLLQKGE